MNAPWQKAGTLDVLGHSLEYSCTGPPPNEAPTLVLLHEGLGCVQLWRDAPAALFQATGFGVLAFSRAGYGHSDAVDLPRPLDYMSREAIDVLPVVLENIGVQSAVLLGHSDGATIAAIYAGHSVDARLAGVVLIAPHFFTEPTGLKAIAEAKAAFETGDLRARLAKYHRNPDNAFRGWNDSWLNPEFKSWNVSRALDDIRVPVLAIQGRDDPYGTLQQINTIVKRVQSAPVSTLILDDCRHSPHQEQALPVFNAIAEFCSQLKA